ncbi:hypothetical protein EVG20_g10331 [Dentipellis fragilis]|uniref:Uncharacterized protein n=1 Tax=Dentipellis fragilis TaxID=205917 RepID=A0A4Y9XU46_9AGAM|nr:hypothetical protein EVG20_g10331 [Dentipellis fragilis]
MAAASRTHTPQAAAAPALSVEEEDAIIHSRITNDERALRRVIKKFHTYASAAHANANDADADADAREAFLVELAAFSLQLKKAFMVCEAEARQVEEHQRERQRIEDERGRLEGQIEQLKTALEHAQVERRRKMEYDVFAEKINTLPTRDELAQTIKSLENDMAAIRADHDAQARLIETQKASLGTIISELGAIRLLGKETDADAEPSPESPTASASPRDGSPAVPAEDEKEEGEEGEEDLDHPSSDDIPLSATLNPNAKPFSPRISASPRLLRSSSGRASSSAKPEEASDDIEMGEVAEDPKDNRGKRKARLEELEEGEASDMSSELSELPDD